MAAIWMPGFGVLVFNACLTSCPVRSSSPQRVMSTRIARAGLQALPQGILKAARRSTFGTPPNLSKLGWESYLRL